MERNDIEGSGTQSRNRLRRVGDALLSGFSSIGEGMRSISLNPKYEVHILGDEEARIADSLATKSDWDASMRDMDDSIKDATYKRKEK